MLGIGFMLEKAQDATVYLSHLYELFLGSIEGQKLEHDDIAMHCGFFRRTQ